MLTHEPAAAAHSTRLPSTLHCCRLRPAQASRLGRNDSLYQISASNGRSSKGSGLGSDGSFSVSSTQRDSSASPSADEKPREPSEAKAAQASTATYGSTLAAQEARGRSVTGIKVVVKVLAEPELKRDMSDDAANDDADADDGGDDGGDE